MRFYVNARNNIFYIVFFPLSIIILCQGCASFAHVDTRIVDHPPRRIGPVSQELIRYYPPKIISVHNGNSVELSLSCEKTVNSKIEFEIPTHDEKVLQREVSKFEKALEDNYLRGHLVNRILWLPFLPIILLEYPFLTDKIIENKYETIQGSENKRFDYKYEEKTVPASDITLNSNKIRGCTTNDQGICTLVGNPSAFDNGIEIVHEGSGEIYYIQRTKHAKTVISKAPWYNQARIGNILLGAGLTVIRVEKIIAMGGGPLTIGGAIIIDIATDCVIGYIIDILATEERTEYFYRWSVVPSNRIIKIN